MDQPGACGDNYTVITRDGPVTGHLITPIIAALRRSTPAGMFRIRHRCVVTRAHARTGAFTQITTGAVSRPHLSLSPTRAQPGNDTRRSLTWPRSCSPPLPLGVKVHHSPPTTKLQLKSRLQRGWGRAGKPRCVQSARLRPVLFSPSSIQSWTPAVRVRGSTRASFTPHCSGKKKRASSRLKSVSVQRHGCRIWSGSRPVSSPRRSRPRVWV